MKKLVGVSIVTATFMRKKNVQTNVLKDTTGNKNSVINVQLVVKLVKTI